MALRPSELQSAHERLLAYKGPYLGNAEFAGILGIKKANLCNKRRRGKLPVPLVKLAMGPVWSVGQVRVWLNQQESKST
jgi:hypothetical protein